MSEPVRVEVVGKVEEGSVLRIAGDPPAETLDGVVEQVRRVAGHDRFVIVVGVDFRIEPPTVPPEELSALGVVQEVNRRMLHPLGMKLGWRPDEPFLWVYDDRDDPEGVRFEGFDLDPRHQAFKALWTKRTPPRQAALGYVVQPVNDPAATG